MSALPKLYCGVECADEGRLWAACPNDRSEPGVTDAAQCANVCKKKRGQEPDINGGGKGTPPKEALEGRS